MFDITPANEKITWITQGSLFGSSVPIITRKKIQSIKKISIVKNNENGVYGDFDCIHEIYDILKKRWSI